MQREIDNLNKPEKGKSIGMVNRSFVIFIKANGFYSTSSES